MGTFNCLLEEREQPEPLPGKGSFTEEKNLFCMHAEREQAQPQLYGTSYLLVKIALTDHKVEFAFLLQAEHDDDMLEIWDQSQSIQLDYQDRRGRIQRPHHTADYFLFRYGQSGWVECKTTQELIRQAQTRPNRYQLNEQEQWRCPAGEAFAAKYGLFYQVYASGQVNGASQDNWLFLTGSWHDSRETTHCS